MEVAKEQNLIKKILTSRDYVQDGLVSMLDAIDNITFGKHDGLASVWKDLKGSSDESIPSEATWTENGLYLGTSSACLLSWNELKGKVFSVEAVVTSYQDALAARPLPGFTANANPYLSPDLSFRPSANSSECAFWKDAHGQFKIQKSQVPQTCGWMFTGTQLKVMFNGKVVVVEDNPYDTTQFTASKLHWQYGTVHCARLYSRELSAEEQALNYEIDKARFGI